MLRKYNPETKTPTVRYRGDIPACYKCETTVPMILSIYLYEANNTQYHKYLIIINLCYFFCIQAG